MTDEMVRYYARRAAEYERIYQQPRWQADLVHLRVRIPEFLAGRQVFEVACGTGYWTDLVARTAASVLATDANDEPLAIARARQWSPHRVRLLQRDAYGAAAGPPAHDGGLAALWLSHVDRGRLAQFLAAFHSHLRPGARVFMFDERDSADRPLPASRHDAQGNRYEMRRLVSGERFEIIKNFFEEDDLRRLVAPYAVDAEVEWLTCFWTLAYTTPA